jgi:SAM-dependent methyltransferase
MTIRQAVCEAYSDAAEHPGRPHPFPVGRDFAQDLGYPEDLLAAAPEASVQAFTGVSNVAVFAELHSGDSVLDLGCGAGLDSLIAAWRVGETGRVIGVDFSPPMLRRVRAARAPNAVFVLAAAEQLPLPGGSIDVALVNGIFNLNPARTAIFHELARVLRPGGAVYGAELVLRDPAPEPAPSERPDWFA